MYISKKSLSRRTLLKGVGVSIGLPFLDAMVPAFGETNIRDNPKRVTYLYLPTGRQMDVWIPSTTGLNYEIPPTLKPLEKFKDKFSILSGLDVVNGKGSHSGPCATYLTGVAPNREIGVGISVDQVIAKSFAEETQLASMELGVDPPEWAFNRVDGLAGYYTSTISWRGPKTPLPTQINPRKIFERMFGDTDTLNSETMSTRIKNKKSILDSLSQATKRLLTTVPAVDKYKLNEYLDSVRDVEKSIQIAEERNVVEYIGDEEITRPTGIPRTYKDHVRLIFDMMVLAYQTDITRMITFMLGHEGTNRNYLELGAKDGHHSLTHHKGRQEAIALVKKIELHQSEQIAYFINRMQNVDLLDDTIIVVGGAHSDSNMHTHKNVPMMVFGGSSGISKGNHIAYNHMPVSNVHMRVMGEINVDPTEFLREDTDATGELTI
jgi:hypothetical protein